MSFQWTSFLTQTAIQMGAHMSHLYQIKKPVKIALNFNDYFLLQKKNKNNNNKKTKTKKKNKQKNKTKKKQQKNNNNKQTKNKTKQNKQSEDSKIE